MRFTRSIGARVALAGCILLPAAYPDKLTLKNGPPVEGTLTGSDGQALTFAGADGVPRKYPIGDVKSIEFLPAAAAKPAAARPAPVVVPQGTQIAVRMIDGIDATTSGAGQKYRASIDDPIAVGSQVVIPRGANCIVQVANVEGTKEIALKLYEITIGGKSFATASEFATLKGQGATKKKKALRRGVGLGAVGAGIGAIAGGGSGAAIGAAVGAGVGAISAAAAKGQTLKVPSETQLEFTLKSPLPVS